MKKSKPVIIDVTELVNQYLDVGYYYFQSFTQSVPWNNHPRFEIMYVEQGTVRAWFKNATTGEESGEVLITKGQGLLIDPYLMHRMEIVDCRIYNVEFNVLPIESAPVTVMPAATIFGENNHVRYMVSSNKSHYYICNDSYQLRTIMQQILSEFDDGGCKPTSGNFMTLNLLGSQLILAFARAYHDSHESNGSLYVRRVNRFIAQNFQNDIKMSDIATAVRLNETYMLKFYKQATGRSISDYLLHYRIAKAKLLMSNTSLPLIDIAVEVGFNSRQVFFNNFKKVTGMSPKEYRAAKAIKE